MYASKNYDRASIPHTYIPFNKKHYRFSCRALYLLKRTYIVHIYPLINTLIQSRLLRKWGSHSRKQKWVISFCQELVGRVLKGHLRPLQYTNVLWEQEE